jgi:hypothetical protein
VKKSIRKKTEEFRVQKESHMFGDGKQFIVDRTHCTMGK